MRFYSSLLLKHVQYLVNTRNREKNSTFYAWYHMVPVILPFHSLSCYLQLKHHCNGSKYMFNMCGVYAAGSCNFAGKTTNSSTDREG